MILTSLLSSVLATDVLATSQWVNFLILVEYVVEYSRTYFIILCGVSRFAV